MRNNLFLLSFPVILFFSCQSQGSSAYSLTSREKFLCDSLEIAPAVIQSIRKYNTSAIEAFQYAGGAVNDYGEKPAEVKPIPLKGIVFEESHQKAYDIILQLKDTLRQGGYTIFLLDAHFDIDGKKDVIAVLKTTDQFQILKYIGTDGINYDITNDSLISILERFDKNHQLELIGASGDYCEFVMHKDPDNWLSLAQLVYKVCPDVVYQGSGSIEALAMEMQRTKRLYLWWD